MQKSRKKSEKYQSSQKGDSLGEKRPLRALKRMQKQMAISKMELRSKVDPISTDHIGGGLTASYSCTTKKDCQSTKPDSARYSRRPGDQRCYRSTTIKLLIRNSQDHSSNKILWLGEDSFAIPGGSPPVRYYHIRYSYQVLPGH